MKKEKQNSLIQAISIPALSLFAAIFAAIITNYGINKNSICESKVRIAEEVVDLAGRKQALALSEIGVPEICYIYDGTIGVKRKLAPGIILSPEKEAKHSLAFAEWGQFSDKLAAKTEFLARLLDAKEVPQKNLSGGILVLDKLNSLNIEIQNFIGS